MLYTFRHPKEKHQIYPVILRCIGINHLQEAVERTQGLGMFQWFYCVEGTGELILNHQSFRIKPGQGFLLFSQTAHAYRPLSDSWRLHLIGFSGPCAADIMKTLRIHESAVYHFSDPNIFEQHVNKIWNLHCQNIPNKRHTYSKACYEFLLDTAAVTRRIHIASPAENNEIIYRIVHYIEENYASYVSLADLEKLTGLTKEYMCSLFKAHMNQTIIHYLTMIRIGNAKIMLGEFPEKRIHEIARMCGYENASYFTRVFKEVVGMTPEDYRKN